MDAYVLPATAYVPVQRGRTYTTQSPQDRRRTCNTIIEDDDSYGYDGYNTADETSDDESLADIVKRTLAMPMSPDLDDFPTPKASLIVAVPNAAEWMKSRDDPEFDELYDVSDDDSEIVPLTCSASVRKTDEGDQQAKKRNRYPSIVIPSPSAWPTIQKLQAQQKSAMASSIPPTPPSKIAPSPKVLSMIAARSLTVPAQSATPSLDGSLTSEEMDKISCPSTPDIQSRRDDADWDRPMQLNPEAMATLHHISGPPDVEEVNQVLELVPEMQEVAGGPRPFTLPTVETPADDEDPLSAISVPSPGGFFSSLDASARQTWSMDQQDDVPNTSTAEDFYGVPWLDASQNIKEQVVEVPLASPSSASSRTPRPQPAKSNPYEYNENYERELKETAVANLDRTSIWINAQETYLAAIRSPEEQLKARNRADSVISSNNTITSPSKKSVRFLDEIVQSPSSIEEVLASKETTYKEGFDFLNKQTLKTDTFVHSQARAESIHIARRCMAKDHQAQLMGRFILTDPVRPSSKRPISHFYEEEATAQKELIARAHKERQALEQMQPSIWNLEALKAVNGGQLVSQSAARWLSRPASTPIRILDLGGQPTCDWAWQMAMDFPSATVYTVTLHDQTSASDMAGPDNCRHMKVPNMWTLPFPAGHFDVISARSLHALLKVHRPTPSTTSPTTKPAPGDEYDHCLREAQRVLKKGGFLEFSLMDAEVIHDNGTHGQGSGDSSDGVSLHTSRTMASANTVGGSRSTPSRAQALGIEFAFNLRTRGYDPQPTKKFVPRLRRAGFSNVKRAWMVLPMPKTQGIAKPSPFDPVEARESIDMISNEPERCIGPDGDVEEVLVGNTADASCVAGLVGARAWETWMLKLQKEMGKEEGQLLEGVGAAMEEGAAGLAGWRYVTGWARKDW